VSDQQNTTREQRLIANIKKWTGERLIGDDCAVLPSQMLVTADTLVENSHFIIPGISFPDLGWKSLAVNLSDIAAMCGRPRFAVVNLTLPPQVTDRDIEMLYGGIVDCARAYRCRIVGGDLTAGSIIVISITLIADTHENGISLRSAAKTGDVVICTGDFGASAAGLWLMKAKLAGFPHCSNKHFRPLPRLCESWSLIRNSDGRAAAMDASDGLADALVQIGRSSAVGMEVDEAAIPIHQQTQDVARLAGADAMDWALYGGEDYELVATIAAERWLRMQQLPNNTFKKIGTVTDKHSTILLKGAGGRSYPLTLDKTFQPWS